MHNKLENEYATFFIYWDIICGAYTKETFIDQKTARSIVTEKTKFQDYIPMKSIGNFDRLNWGVMSRARSNISEDGVPNSKVLAAITANYANRANLHINKNVINRIIPLKFLQNLRKPSCNLVINYKLNYKLFNL